MRCFLAFAIFTLYPGLVFAQFPGAPNFAFFGGSQCGPNTPAASVSWKSSQSSPSNSDTYTFSNLSIGAAATDRLVIAGIGANAFGPAKVISATIGGVSATIHEQKEDAGNSALALVSAVVPSGTTADIVVQWDRVVANRAVQVFRASGLSSLTPMDTADFGYVYSTTSAPIDYCGGGFIVGVGMVWTGSKFTISSALKSFSKGGRGRVIQGSINDGVDWNGLDETDDLLIENYSGSSREDFVLGSWR